eukprot:s4036_g16.t1
MRWVLTRKSDGRAKARLVVLGYQAHNVTDAETASPTLSRTSRNALLTTAANHKLELESGDISSAFLQSLGDLEKENLLVFAPSELAAMYGADPKEPGMILKLVKAFYGLVHAPRQWYQSVVFALTAHGWRQMTFDRCLFGLRRTGRSGRRPRGRLFDCRDAYGPSLRQSTRALAVKFQIWQVGIVMDQEEYIREWVKEIPISRERLRQSKAPATKAEVAALRGALGIIASQTGPQYQAEVSLLLSRVPTATVNTFDDVNKLIREVRRTATQKVLCMGEDACFLLRALWMEIHGVPISRASLKSDIANCTRGALITTLEEFMMP